MTNIALAGTLNNAIGYNLRGLWKIRSTGVTTKIIKKNNSV